MGALKMAEKVALEIRDIVRPRGLFSRTVIDRDIKRGKLVAHRNGRRKFIFPEDYERYLRSLPRVADGDRAAQEST